MALRGCRCMGGVPFSRSTIVSLAFRSVSVSITVAMTTGCTGRSTVTTWASVTTAGAATWASVTTAGAATWASVTTAGAATWASVTTAAAATMSQRGVVDAQRAESY